eukprot:gb/GFBE01039671.1/.p1 GENE.gb/GFBE01039671.1/~~gb/GFBE01039671.1/.p1  ORF type:complete len:216 (+),score=41.52 gb/GFBE01039671.1/:1-648(+)
MALLKDGNKEVSYARLPSPLYGLWTKISLTIDEYPLLSNSGSSFVLSFLSAAVGQWLSDEVEGFSGSLGRALIFALVAAPPLSVYWYNFLDQFSNNLARTAADQLCWQPLMLSYSMLATSLLQGHGLSTSWEKLKTDLWGTLLLGWTFWPFAQYMNQRFLPLRLRVIAMAVVAFMWDMYYSVQCFQQVTGISTLVHDEISMGVCNATSSAPFVIR